MGFSEGTEDEFLLTCFVCKAPFGMLAAFCGGCGARRDQAMGVERAKSSQQITQNVIQTVSLEKSQPMQRQSDIEPIKSQPSFGTATTTEAPTRPKRQRKKSIRRQIFISNMRLRIDAINSWQSRHAISLNLSGLVLFFGATYLFVQSFIVGISHPEVAAEQHLKAGIVRDASYFDVNTELGVDSKFPVFPVKYAKGEGASAWFNSSSIHGLTGSAEITISPVGSQYDQTPITLKMKATYEKKYGIFRTPIWAPSEPTATIEIKYPNTSNTLIYINGYLAGSTDKPAVKEGTYFIYPGRLSVKFYKNGDETNDSFEYFIQASGKY